jgi:DNA-binding PadR family transcriptional regulator
MSGRDLSSRWRGRYYREPISAIDMTETEPLGLYAGFIRLHVLHHAAQEPVFGLGLIDEIGRHGYRLSPGTLYPILHGLEAQGLLRSKSVRGRGGRQRRMYRATPAGQRVLAAAKLKVQELFGELFNSA